MNDEDLTLSQLSIEVGKTAIYPRVRLLVGDSNNIDDAVDAPWLYPILGLCGEAGELANQAKKIIRDDGGILTPGRRVKMLSELGDNVWYIPRIAHGLHAALVGVVWSMLDKLRGRAERGTLQGSGDTR